MTFVKLGAVRAFPGAVPDKAQALKPLEEAAEVFGAWQLMRDTVESGLNAKYEKADPIDEIAEALR